MGVRGSAVGRGLSPHTHLTQKIPHWSYMSIWMLVLGGREGGREERKKGDGEEKKGKRGKERSSGGEKKRERRVYSMRYISAEFNITCGRRPFSVHFIRTADRNTMCSVSVADQSSRVYCVVFEVVVLV